ncbi:hypothetical protein QBC45DRAFT_437420 [Copromyces sp. CBS 386.78]|nr:hypothetical protein QBC45DRAFT_437420 [Copromyces sp. CBS 386.78]
MKKGYSPPGLLNVLAEEKYYNNYIKYNRPNNPGPSPNPGPNSGPNSGANSNEDVKRSASICLIFSHPKTGVQRRPPGARCRVPGAGYRVQVLGGAGYNLPSLDNLQSRPTYRRRVHQYKQSDKKALDVADYTPRN